MHCKTVSLYRFTPCPRRWNGGYGGATAADIIISWCVHFLLNNFQHNLICPYIRYNSNVLTLMRPGFSHRRRPFKWPPWCWKRFMISKKMISICHAYHTLLYILLGINILWVLTLSIYTPSNNKCTSFEYICLLFYFILFRLLQWATTMSIARITKRLCQRRVRRTLF